MNDDHSDLQSREYPIREDMSYELKVGALSVRVVRVAIADGVRLGRALFSGPVQYPGCSQRRWQGQGGIRNVSSQWLNEFDES